MRFLEAAESGSKFKHKNWCSTCWHGPFHIMTKKWICETGVTVEEMFSEDWEIQHTAEVTSTDLLEAFKRALSKETLSRKDLKFYHSICGELFK